jgi:hypothetical protein
MSKQTALQWFIYKITVNHDKHFIDMYRSEIEEALQMEREQIIDAYYEGKEYGFKEQGEQYYNETYGGKDE